MILLPRSVRIYVATAPVNLRKSFEGLSNEVRTVLAADPLSGHVYIFLNRARTQVKLLMFTRGGFTIVHNLLVGKYKRGLPLYRQAEALEHLGCRCRARRWLTRSRGRRTCCARSGDTSSPRCSARS